ncbi:hypothetical protein GOODEAATRI_014022 [Goodea atripinnis]|uniref:RRM domain-containing protein n=1 Tax=Goodea atripinnis TaxID=208336 RepID=A0ABV0NXT9_9TELE
MVLHMKVLAHPDIPPANRMIQMSRLYCEHICLFSRRYIEVFPSNRDNIQAARRRTRMSLNPSQSASRRPVPDSQTNHRGGSYQISDVSTHYIHMRGLPFQVSGEDIVKFFSPLAVSKILVEFRPDGRPSGEADVYFSCHRDALDAMSRDRMNMGRNFISDQKVLIGFIGYLE